MRRLRRHRLALGLMGLALLLGAWGALGVAEVMSARRQAAAAEAAARDAANLVGSGDLEGARVRLGNALDSLVAAQRSLSSPWVAPARLVPYVGSEVRAAEAGVVAVRNTSQATLDLLSFVLADRAPIYAEGRLEPEGLAGLRTTLAGALGVVADARGALNAAPRPRLGFVAERFAEADRVTASLYDTLSGALPLVDRLSAAARGEDPYRLLLVLENGAERRATGGLPGWYTVLHIDETGVSLDAFGSVVGALQARDAAGKHIAVEAPVDYIRRYGEFMANTTLWANVNLSPDFPTVAEVARRLYAVGTGVEVDAAARVDLVGLGYLLDAFPTLTVGDVPLEGAALATDFLIDSYRQFPDDTRPGEQNAFLGEAVQEVFSQLVGGAAADRAAVFSALRRATAERRMALVTGEAAVDSMLAAAGADGGVLPGGHGDLMVTTQNFGRNKIDLFTTTAFEVGLAADDCRVEGGLTLVLMNATPAGMEFMPRGNLVNYGRWMVTVYPPRGASVMGLEVNGQPVGGAFLEEFGRTAVSVIVDADLGESVSVTVRWAETLTQPGYTLTLQPQPLVVPATLAVNGETPVRFVETVRREFPGFCRG
ncbi:MAG: DUF4012 domain-containing protein [Actinobacteria bacterium]|nr:DUF4012 domain-containing protein [Actinomycetota bacterium]